MNGNSGLFIECLVDFLVGVFSSLPWLDRQSVSQSLTGLIGGLIFDLLLLDHNEEKLNECFWYITG